MEIQLRKKNTDFFIQAAYYWEDREKLVSFSPTSSSFYPISQYSVLSYTTILDDSHITIDLHYKYCAPYIVRWTVKGVEVGVVDGFHDDQRNMVISELFLYVDLTKR